MVSAFTGKKVRERIAMTGEMTLRGKVLPIGGVKEKLLAAKRAGIVDIILCEKNRKDVDDIPAKYLKGLRFHYVQDIQEVIDFAIVKKTKKTPQRGCLFYCSGVDGYLLNSLIP